MVLPERRKLQRDWLGHSIEFGMLLAAIGLPMLYWGSGVNSTTAALNQRVDRLEMDMKDFRVYQVTVTSQLLTISKDVATIAAQVNDLHDTFRHNR